VALYCHLAAALGQAEFFKPPVETDRSRSRPLLLS
jgi:hypothetical protein